jgi:hypothetical protein
MLSQTLASSRLMPIRAASETTNRVVADVNVAAGTGERSGAAMPEALA